MRKYKIYYKKADIEKLHTKMTYSLFSILNL